MAKEFCSICGKKITFGESPYSGVFKDGEACEACRGRLNSLLETKSVWISPDLLASRSWKSFDRIGMKKMTVAQAQELAADGTVRSKEVLAVFGAGFDSPGVVFNSFRLGKHISNMFILRAMKFRYKPVIETVMLDGSIKKGDTICCMSDGVTIKEKVMDAIPHGTWKFYDELTNPARKHALKPEKLGWLVLDPETDQEIPTGSLVAKVL